MTQREGRTLLLTGALLALLPALLPSCASIGRPEGGARDSIPPLFVRSNPMPGSTDVMPQNMALYFNENLSLDNPTQKIVVSPPMATPPVFNSNGKRISVDFRDTLKPNTTYTIDFADAIRDLNESNVLDGFAIDFATGPTRDTLSISGMVFEARNLEPAQGMLVGVYSDSLMADTTLTTLPFERVTKTNGYGRFTLRNLAPGNYRLFAVNDMNRDYHWDRSEDVAFYDIALSPTTREVMLSDTLTDAAGQDSIVERPGVRYLPDDVLMTWFNENYQPRYLLKQSRPEARILELLFSAPADSMPRLRTPDGRPASDWSLLQGSHGFDTLTVWLTDTAMIGSDTLTVITDYQFTDTLDQTIWRTDTLKFNFRRPKAKTSKPKKNKADTTAVDTIVGPKEFLSLTLTPSSTQDLNKGIVLSGVTPFARLDSAGVRMEMMVDTLWEEIAPPRLLLLDSLNRMTYVADYEWTPKTRYRLSVDSAAVTDIYDIHNKPIVQEFTTKSPEDYSTLIFNIPALTDSVTAYVELLRSDDPILQKQVNGTRAVLDYLTPGKYYARLFIDRNGNGKWDTGNVALGLQPEDVFYYNKEVNLKKNWDVEQQWDLYSIAVDLQKPEKIKKNKPPKNRWDDKKTTEEPEEPQDELWDKYSRDPFFQR